jgi:hypothetical protein
MSNTEPISVISPSVDVSGNELEELNLTLAITYHFPRKQVPEFFRHSWSIPIQGRMILTNGSMSIDNLQLFNHTGSYPHSIESIQILAVGLDASYVTLLIIRTVRQLRVHG